MHLDDLLTAHCRDGWVRTVLRSEPNHHYGRSLPWTSRPPSGAGPRHERQRSTSIPLGLRRQPAFEPISAGARPTHEPEVVMVGPQKAAVRTGTNFDPFTFRIQRQLPGPKPGSVGDVSALEKLTGTAANPAAFQFVT